jgi:hypothetical protein
MLRTSPEVPDFGESYLLLAAARRTRMYMAQRLSRCPDQERLEIMNRSGRTRLRLFLPRLKQGGPELDDV